MSLNAFADYKPSGVEWLGEIPNHWDIAPCRSIVYECKEKNEGGTVTEYLSVVANVGVIPYAEKGDIGNKKPVDLSKCKIVSTGDFVINSMNYRIGSFGVSNFEGVCSPVYIVLRPRVDKIDKRFAFRLFENKDFQEYAQSFGNGILEHRAAINWDILKRIHVPIPPIHEQRAIADYLDIEIEKIDALRMAQERLIVLLKEKRHSIISHAVTRGLNPNTPMEHSGIEWLGGIPKHWSVCNLKFLASAQTGIAKGKDNKDKDTVEVPYLRVANVQDGYLDLAEITTMEIPTCELDRFSLKTGDVLMNEGGDFDKLGRGCIWRGEIEPCVHQNHVFAIRPKFVSSEWLNQITSSMYAQFYFMSRSKQSTNLASISLRNLLKLPVVLPPEEEQREILTYIDKENRKIDRLIEEATRAIALLKERRATLISTAVTGKIDIRHLIQEEVPDHE